MSQSARKSARTSTSITAVIIIVAITVGYQLYASSDYVTDESMSFADFSYGISSIAVGITAFFVAKRYRGSPVFGKTYLALALGFVSLFVGDLIYNYYLLVLDEDPYPSIADAFFIAFYAFAGYHIVKNIQYFQVPENTSRSKALYRTTCRGVRPCSRRHRCQSPYNRRPRLLSCRIYRLGAAF